MQRRWITDWTPSERWPHYTRATASDVLPGPVTPLTVQFCWEGGLIPGWRDAYVQSGNYSLDEFDDDHPEVVGFFGGYFYLNLSNVRMQGVRSPALTVEQIDAALFGDAQVAPPHDPVPADERPDLVEAAIGHLGWILTSQDYPEIDDFCETVRVLRADRPSLASLSAHELIARARAMQPLLRTGFRHHRTTTSASSVAPGLLQAIGRAMGDPTIPMVLCAGIGSVDTAEPSYRLWELSRMVRNSQSLTAAFDNGVDGLLARLADDEPDLVEFMTEWDRFIVDFGGCSPNDWELLAPSWETEPEVALDALERARHQNETESPMIRNRLRATERATKLAEVRTAIAALHNDELAAQLEGAIVAINQLAFRERTKSSLLRVLHECRMVFLEIGRRAVAAEALERADHVFMLLDRELEAAAADPASMRSTLAERHRQWLELAELEPPFIIADGEVPPLDEWSRTDAGTPEQPAASGVAGDIVRGVPGCSGMVHATARVVEDPWSPTEIEPGQILVAARGDMALTPLYVTASAVVLGTGGQLSHATIIARELGVPCVVSADRPTERIPDGALIEVDGGTGQITILDVA